MYVCMYVCIYIYIYIYIDVYIICKSETGYGTVKMRRPDELALELVQPPFAIHATRQSPSLSLALA